MLKSLHLDRMLAEQPAVELWPQAAGEAIAQHARALTIDNGVLTVAVDGAGWLTQLVYLRPELVRRLNALAGRQLVSDIRFRLDARAGRERS